MSEGIVFIKDLQSTCNLITSVAEITSGTHHPGSSSTFQRMQIGLDTARIASGYF